MVAAGSVWIEWLIEQGRCSHCANRNCRKQQRYCPGNAPAGMSAGDFISERVLLVQEEGAHQDSTYILWLNSSIKLLNGRAAGSWRAPLPKQQPLHCLERGLSRVRLGNVSEQPRRELTRCRPSQARELLL